MGLAARLLWLGCGEGQVRHTAEVEEYVLLSINASQEYVPAKGTPHDEAGALHI